MHVTHGGRSNSIEDPLPTVTGANRGEQALVSAHLQTHFGERQGQAPRVHSIDEPTPALTSREPALVEGFLTNYHGQSKAMSLDAPVPTLSTKDRIALVQPVLNGVALDIRFRMLQPHELAAAMGFGINYAFKGNRADAVRQIGNAVAVNMAKALCKAALSGNDHDVEEVA
jgi:DNA (cytosine-5)-methyltransferase 1